ncbi:MAG: tRNA preQ1(34) S-adenosylmethionine ribosyltransferase-isomerase QueA, partial [SAR202 cluster bacterium Io17-Chloro-G2]
MHTSDFDYDLPPELIAQTPLEPRDSSRLLVLDRASGRISHRHFKDIVDYLRPSDVMVFNQSRVIPARLRGRRADTGGKVEFLLLRRESPDTWQALAQPGRRLRPGAEVIIEPPAGKTSGAIGPPFAKGGSGGFHAQILASNEDGTKMVRLPADADLDRLGYVPLPPYIHHRLEDPDRYQTVYAKDLGSAAAPTAGLHFTQDLLVKIRAVGVETAFVTLHVGLDTFRPV